MARAVQDSRAAEDAEQHVLFLDEPTAALPASEVDRALEVVQDAVTKGQVHHPQRLQPPRRRIGGRGGRQRRGRQRSGTAERGARTSEPATPLEALR